MKSLYPKTCLQLGGLWHKDSVLCRLQLVRNRNGYLPFLAFEGRGEVGTHPTYVKAHTHPHKRVHTYTFTSLKAPPSHTTPDARLHSRLCTDQSRTSLKHVLNPLQLLAQSLKRSSGPRMPRILISVSLSTPDRPVGHRYMLMHA